MAYREYCLLFTCLGVLIFLFKRQSWLWVHLALAVLHLNISSILVSQSSLFFWRQQFSFFRIVLYRQHFCHICSGEIKMVKSVLLRLDFNLFFPSHSTCVCNTRINFMVRYKFIFTSCWNIIWCLLSFVLGFFYVTHLIVSCSEEYVSLKKLIFIFQRQISSERFRSTVSWDECWFH